MMKNETENEMKAGEYTYSVWLRRWDDGTSIDSWIVARDDDELLSLTDLVRSEWQLKMFERLDGPEQVDLFGSEFVDFDDLCEEFIAGAA